MTHDHATTQAAPPPSPVRSLEESILRLQAVQAEADSNPRIVGLLMTAFYLRRLKHDPTSVQYMERTSLKQQAHSSFMGLEVEILQPDLYDLQPGFWKLTERRNSPDQIAVLICGGERDGFAFWTDRTFKEFPGYSIQARYHDRLTERCTFLVIVPAEPK